MPVSPPPPWPRSAANRRAGAGRGLTFTFALLLALASGCSGPGVIRIEQGTLTDPTGVLKHPPGRA